MEVPASAPYKGVPGACTRSLSRHLLFFFFLFFFLYYYYHYHYH